MTHLHLIYTQSYTHYSYRPRYICKVSLKRAFNGLQTSRQVCGVQVSKDVLNYRNVAAVWFANLSNKC